MFTRISSFGLAGIDAYRVSVEVDLSRGMPSFDLVGLPDAAVKESRDRVRSAVKNNGFEFPVGRVVANLSPAGVRKLGSLYDLPLFVGLLAAAGLIPPPPPDAAFVGELSLDGALNPVPGVLPMALEARAQGVRALYVPAQNGPEGAAAEGVDVYPVPSAAALLAHLSGQTPLRPLPAPPFEAGCGADGADFADVKGQEGAKRALEIAAAGMHCILLIGPPGSGKSMLAQRLPSILPPLTLEEAVEVTKVHSIAGALPPGGSLVSARPYRHPHHTVSATALAGGSAVPRPGELSLAHEGVLFLDELPEFSRASMEALRQPMEDGTISVSRVSGTCTFPCSTLLVGAMNPCKCGFYGHPTRPCTCAPTAVTRYLSKLSGPLLDRFDLQMEVMPVEYEHLASGKKAERSENIRARVIEARLRQSRRYRGMGFSCNARISPAAIDEACAMTPAARTLLGRAFDTMGLSARGYTRVLKVARTIADLDGAETIDLPHVAEAVQYRSLDRKYWG